MGGCRCCLLILLFDRPAGWLPTGSVRTCVIFNPTARGDRARRWTSKLEGLGDACVLLPTTGPGGGIGLARRAVEEGFEKIVAAGGDGTINEVINGIALANGLEKTRLGGLPWGSGNVFAKAIRGKTDRFVMLFEKN